MNMNRAIALQWWENLSETKKNKYAKWFIKHSKYCTHAVIYEDLNTDEIEIIWNKFKTTSTP